MSKIETNTIDNISGSSALQIGDTNTATIGLGKSGDTITIPSGATITNSGTATGFGDTNYFSTTGFSTYINTTQTITSGAETVLPFDTERYDLGSAFDTSAYTYTPPSNGYYMFSFGVSFRGGADDNLERCNVGMKKASSTYQDWEKDFSASYVLNANTSATIFANVSDSDAYKVYVNITDQSGNPQVLGTITNSYFEGCRIA
jgi:hypothetical protein